jgi:hypothetical protein
VLVPGTRFASTVWGEGTEGESEGGGRSAMEGRLMGGGGGGGGGADTPPPWPLPPTSFAPPEKAGSLEYLVLHVENF